MVQSFPQFHIVRQGREREKEGKVVFFLIRELQRERNGLGGSGTKREKKKNSEKKPLVAKNRWRRRLTGEGGDGVEVRSLHATGDAARNLKGDPFPAKLSSGRIRKGECFREEEKQIRSQGTRRSAVSPRSSDPRGPH